MWFKFLQIARKEEIIVKEKESEKHKDEAAITPSVEVFCSKHPDCCYTKGCPAFFEYRSGKAVFKECGC